MKVILETKKGDLTVERAKKRHNVVLTFGKDHRVVVNRDDLKAAIDCVVKEDYD